MKKSEPRRVPLHLKALWLTLAYAIVGAGWIFYSDRSLALLLPDSAQFARYQTYKGLLFIAVTALLLYRVAARESQPPGLTDMDGAAGERRVRILALTCATLFIFAILANLVFTLINARQEVLAKAEHSGASLAQMLEEQTAGNLNAVELALALTSKSIQLVPAQNPARNQVIQDLLTESIRNLPFVRGVWIVAPNGVMIHDSERLPGRYNFSDREYFQVHRDNPAHGFFIDKPILSRHGVWFIGVSRRIDNPDGSFGGVIVAALEPKYLQDFYQSIKVGNEGIVSLVRTDGTLMLRAPALDHKRGHKMVPTPPFVDMARAADSGNYVSTSVFDGVERRYSFRRIVGRPLLVVVGLSEQESLAEWQAMARSYALMSFSFMLMIAWLGYLVWHELRRRAALNIALSDSERSLAAAQALSQVGSWTMDLRNRRAHWSNEMYRLFRRDPSMGPPPVKQFPELLHPDDRAMIAAVHHHLIRNGGSWSGEMRSNPAYGPIRYYGGRAAAITNMEGDVVALEGTTQDITERRQSEEKLRLAARVFEHTNDGITITDASANIVAVNAAFERITGYKEAEAIGRNPNMLHSDRHESSFYHAMWNALRVHGQWRGEIWNRRKNGSVYPQWLSISAIKDAQNHCTGYVGVFNDLSEIREANQQLDFLTSHDPLTHLPNRTLLNDRLQQAIEVAEPAGRQVALLLLNIDRLRRVNDSIGHDAGDALLKKMADRLLAQLPPGDTLARLGSDEFVIVLTSAVDTDAIMTTAQRLIEEVAKPCVVLGHELTVTASTGISIYPYDGGNPNDLLKAADTALSSAKNEGRNSFRFFTAEMNARAQHWLSIEHQLRRAIVNNELLLHYQPQVSLLDGRICGCEALIRWQHPELGLIPPADFIPIAEDTGLIVAIGEWVLRAACAQNKAWQDAGLPPMPVAVNVSALQISTGTLPAVVQRTLDETGLAPQYLEVELTETVMLKETELALQQIAAVRQLGVQVSLDDFGTGFSSLGYLSRFTLDKLKIDQGFTRNITTDARSAAIVHATITLAHGLGIKVIAEGVEEVEQIGYLRTAGCDEIQGYYISRPVLPEDLAIMMRRGQLLSDQ